MTRSHADAARLDPRDRPGVLSVTVLNAKNLDELDLNSPSDPYVVLTVDGMQQKTTRTVKDSNNPDWNEPFEFAVQHPTRSVLRVQVFDWNRWTDHGRLGWVEIGINEVASSDGVAECEYLLNEARRGGTLKLTLRFGESPASPGQQ